MQQYHGLINGELRCRLAAARRRFHWLILPSGAQAQPCSNTLQRGAHVQRRGLLRPCGWLLLLLLGGPFSCHAPVCGHATQHGQQMWIELKLQGLSQDLQPPHAMVLPSTKLAQLPCCSWQ